MNFFDIGSYKAESANNAYLLSERLIAEYLTLLRAGFCLQIATSCGKDSTSITNSAIEAMGRAIALGLVEKERPLVILTVDTLLEPEPIQCYVDEAHLDIEKRCHELGINLHAEVVAPPFHHQLMILFANAQKLFATASSGRSADCSKIFKVDTSVRALKRIKSSLAIKYQQATWVSVAGQRSEESTRRSANMTKQGVKSVKADILLALIQQESLPGKVYRFAPISDWTIEDVMTYLTHAGDRPLAKGALGTEIKCYSPNFGLLLAIYGEGSNERCEIVASEDEKPKQTGCGKIARFGCVTCGMVSEDKSAKELNEYLRWARFGDSTLRFRDYLTRVSDDVNCRAFHARAYDRSGNNNVFFQPNVLKASVLEKLVWYASQISVDSKKTHDDFVKLHQMGKAHEDIGIIDIQNDESLTASVRQQYIAMYQRRMLKGPMFELFSHKHGVLLSLLWSLHGITALPYRPLAIFNAVDNGKRIPYPLTNNELNAKRAVQGLISFQDELKTQSIPDAVVAQIFTPSKKSFAELKAEHGESLSSKHLQELLPFTLSDYWVNASVQLTQQHDLQLLSYSASANTRKVRLTYSVNTITGRETVHAKCLGLAKSIDLDGNPELQELFISLGRDNFDKNSSNAEIDRDQLFLISNHELSDQVLFTSPIVTYSQQKRARASKTRQFSERKRTYVKALGSYVAGRASLKMYSAYERALELEQRINTISYWLPDYALTQSVNVGTAELDVNDNALNFIFDDYLYQMWLDDGGIERLLQTHDAVLTSRIQDRKPIRQFYGTAPVYVITNTTGLAVSKRLETNFVSTLRRTEVFHQAGLFNAANMDRSSLLEMPNVISMEKHRAQKVNHLLAIRFIKNVQRSEMNNKLNTFNSNLALVDVIDRVNQFVTQHIDISKSFIAAKIFASFNPEAELRAAKLSIWLNEYSNVVSDPNAALKMLSTKQEADEIMSSFDDFSLFIKHYSDKINMIKVTLLNFGKLPCNNIKALALMGHECALSLRSEDNSYFAGGSTNTMVTEIAQLISQHVDRANFYLVEAQLTRVLAYAGNCDYLGHGIVSDISMANTKVKKHNRFLKSMSMLSVGENACQLDTHSCFTSMIAFNPEKGCGAAKTKLNASVKSSKLALLMKSNINQFNNLLTAG
ncbi:phosphoadenosine phosphosulfate reductase family protein [Shewanella sp. BF02_Schw]|uniref:phosphoadenosine phosphosulfate reductase domain-containing protein n=1 Tax=Shewanella sp. BF02_Schw TaxID=394908 RepID=UPI0017810E51|nr:phosphoadenosine phosphosulfate reductase family protein [Shewanella sp. BF02_Schw]MBO1897735.1 phosphoadenosine phosphosulfate reductase family protein [Shewanella sp. BF02_Schw]